MDKFMVKGLLTNNDLEKLKKLALNIRKSSLCGLGQTAPNPVLSTLKYFRKEYEEHNLRMEDEHKRQNVRIEQLEKDSKTQTQTLIAIERIAVSVENMQNELSDQGKRLDELESHDGEMWRKVIGYVVSSIVGAVICFIFTQIGM